MRVKGNGDVVLESLLLRFVLTAIATCCRDIKDELSSKCSQEIFKTQVEVLPTLQMHDA